MIRMTAKEYQDFLTKSDKCHFVDAVPANTSRNKYRNVKVYCYEDGFISYGEKISSHGKIVQKYDSIKEYHRHCELLLLERAGKISDLEAQKALLIAEAFTDSAGKKHRAILYRADFFYAEQGAQVVEDVKGFDKKAGKHLTTKAFDIKWKLLQAKYPAYIFKLF